MNDLNDLLQQIIGMNTAWLQIAVTAQSAFDTIDAAALKTQKVLRDTLADVEEMSKNFLRIENTKINIKIGSVEIGKDTLQQINTQITHRIEVATQKQEIGNSESFYQADNTESEKPKIYQKLAKGLFKGIAKTGIQTLLKRSSLKKILPKKVLEESAKSLLKSNLMEEGASTMSEIAGDSVAATLGEAGFGEILAGIGGLGAEAGLLAVAPEVALAIGGIYVLKKIFSDSNSQKTYPLPAMPYYDNSILPIAKNNFEVISIDPKTGKELKGKAARDSKYASFKFKPERTPTFVPDYNSIPKLQKDVDNTSNYAESQTRGGILAAKKRADELQNQSKFVPNYKLIDGSIPYAVDHTSNFAETQIKGFEHFAEERALKEQAQKVGINNSDGNEELTYSRQYDVPSIGTTGAKVINININKAFIENFSIHAQNIQQGYDGLKQKVEEIFLEILNSANAIHD